MNYNPQKLVVCHFTLEELQYINAVMKWAKEFEISKRRVAETINGKIRVSTVFLGVDHAWNGGPPEVFETMIFGGDDDGYCERYSTWEEAEVGHKKAVELVREKYD